LESWIKSFLTSVSETTFQKFGYFPKVYFGLRINKLLESWTISFLTSVSETTFQKSEYFPKVYFGFRINLRRQKTFGKFNNIFPEFRLSKNFPKVYTSENNFWKVGQ
jgi:hypothetical protein